MSGNLYGKGVSSVAYLTPTDSSIGNTSISTMAKTIIIPRTIYVTGVTLNKSTSALLVDGTETLVATIAPFNADTQTIMWTSDDELIATVEDGLVTAIGAGEAIITVTTTDGSKTATCVVTVTTE